MFNMSMAQSRNGSRLAYVVVPIDGTVKREVMKVVKKGKAFSMERVLVEQPAGYMVYFPRGHALRIRDKEQLAHYGLDPKHVPICNLQGLSDPKSAIGQMLASQDDDTRAKAWSKLEEQVVRLATAKTGSILMPEQIAQQETA